MLGERSNLAWRAVKQSPQQIRAEVGLDLKSTSEDCNPSFLPRRTVSASQKWSRLKYTEIVGRMSGVARQRLTEERKAWRRDKPFGFHARPETLDDGSINMLKWRCHIPGKQGTDWDGGYFPLTMEFSEDYPAKPPKCKFPAGFFHPNIYPSGTVCLSILNEDEGWRPSITVRSILLGIQELMTDPNPNSPAQSDAFMLYTNNRVEYTKRIRKQTASYPPPQ